MSKVLCAFARRLRYLAVTGEDVLLTRIEKPKAKPISSTRRVMIVAGDRDRCWLLENVLMQDASIIIIGYATDWGQILNVCCGLNPEVILLDLDNLPPDGLETIHLLKMDGSSLAVLGIGEETTRESSVLLDAYWAKQDSLAGLIAAVKTVSGRIPEQ